ncbi:protein neuralized isoform X1 [Bactrocera neohumeralis]|uniref:protein neuralized isoform X1 n=1 Tax=Bactrocera neohumeralis TaxID=98809 RepID=UPI002165ABA9|nr:protein neuralized isoform X1 [Bactrocera neohumeralis]
MGLSENQANSYMPTSTGPGGQVVVMECPNHRISNKKLHILKKIKKRFGLVRRSPSSCPGPNNLPPLQFHTVHGDNIRISRDGTLARRFESFCRAITFSARPVRINERICVRFSEISNNWNGGIRFGFTSNDPATLEGALPKYACPDLTNRPGFWAKALHEQYCEKDNILYYYVNSAGDVIYGINNVEKGVILSGIDTRGLLWTLVDIYGNCTAIEFLDARVYMYQQSGNGLVAAGVALPAGNGGVIGAGGTLPGPQIPLNPHHPHQQSRRSLPAVEQDLDRHVLPSMQSLNISMEQMPFAQDMANGLPPLRYNANGRLIPVPFHITKGRNVRLSMDRFIASRTENDFCQGYVFTARPIRIGEKVIVQILKTEQMYLGALALGLTSCNPAGLQPSDLPNDSDFLLDRPEYWVVSKDIASQPQRGDEIAFFVAPNGEVTISKNNGPAVVVMHVDQSLQLWAFLDVYGSTQSVRMFRQQLPNMINYPQQPLSAAPSTQRLPQHGNMSIAESMNSLNSQMSESRKMLHTSALTVASHNTMNSSAATLASITANAAIAAQTHCNVPAATVSTVTPVTKTNGNTTATATGHMISMPSSGDLIQIQPNGGGTVLVVNLPPANSTHELNSVSGSGNGVSATRQPTSGVLAGACSTTMTNNQYIEPVSSLNGCNSTQEMNKWKDTVDHSGNSSAGAECTICYENQIDSVLYMCGHMCMCYDCAIEQWRGVGGGQCPLCRAVIRDVIRTYTT